MKSMKFWGVAVVLGAIVVGVMGGTMGYVAGLCVFLLAGVLLNKLFSSSGNGPTELDVDHNSSNDPTESALADARPDMVAEKEDLAIMAAVQEQMSEEDDQSQIEVEEPDVLTEDVSENSDIVHIEGNDELDASDFDDLTQIIGLEARFASKLNAMGIIRFDQIASWTEADIDTYTEELGIGRKNRISRQKWVDQAAELSQEDTSL
ncbi:MAG: hypothetical protein ABJO67_11520 [Pseudoruegeria sp.]